MKRMTKLECRMTKECRSRMTKRDTITDPFRVSSFGFNSSFVIRFSSFMRIRLVVSMSGKKSVHFSLFFVAAGSDVSAIASTSTGASPFTRTVPTIRARSRLCSDRSLSLAVAGAGCCAGGAA